MRRNFLSPALVGAMAGVLLVSGCGYEGLNSYTLPGTKGTGDNSIEIKAAFQNMGNVVENQPVLVNDINVGTVTDVELDAWTPIATISLSDDVVLPANVTATIGQNSLLGAKHIQLARPTNAEPEGRLQDGAFIPLERTHNAPETEDVLASVSLLLNGGGLQHIDTIARELNRAMVGRTGDYRALFTELNTFMSGLANQKGDIIGTIDSVNRLSVELNRGMPAIEDALDKAPQALETINNDIEGFRQVFAAMAHWNGTIGKMDQGVKNFDQTLRGLEPTLIALADSGGSSVDALRVLTGVIFPLDGVAEAFKGDGATLRQVNFDLTLPSIDKNFLSGTPFAGMLTDAQKFLQVFSTQAGNPLTAPLNAAGVPLVGLTGVPSELLGGLLGSLGGN